MFTTRFLVTNVAQVTTVAQTRPDTAERMLPSAVSGTSVGVDGSPLKYRSATPEPIVMPDLRFLVKRGLPKARTGRHSRRPPMSRRAKMNVVGLPAVAPSEVAGWP